MLGCRSPSQDDRQALLHVAPHAIRQSHPRDIWESATADAVRDKMKPCKAPCLLNCYRSSGLRDQVAMFKFFFDRQGF